MVKIGGSKRKKDNTYTIPKQKNKNKNPKNQMGYTGYTPLYWRVASPYLPSLSSSSLGFTEELEPDAIPMAWVCVNRCSCIMRA